MHILIVYSQKQRCRYNRYQSWKIMRILFTLFHCSSVTRISKRCIVLHQFLANLLKILKADSDELPLSSKKGFITLDLAVLPKVIQYLHSIYLHIQCLGKRFILHLKIRPFHAVAKSAPKTITAIHLFQNLKFAEHPRHYGPLIITKKNILGPLYL